MINKEQIRALKGAPLSIVMALMMAEEAAGEGWLVSVTGYSPNTVRAGCTFLEEIGMIQRNGRYEGYEVTERQRERQFLTLEPVTTTTTFNKKENEISEKKAEVARTGASVFDARKGEAHKDKGAGASVFDARKGKEGARGPSGASDFDVRLGILYDAGVMEPTAARLLDYAWVTAEYLEAHIAKAKREGTAIPLLIHRIRSHDPKPKEQEHSIEAYRMSWLGAS